jgi:TonB family protein
VRGAGGVAVVIIRRSRRLLGAVMAPALLLAFATPVSIQAPASEPAEQQPSKPVATDAATRVREVRLDSKCNSRELPLDGAPLPALSLDPAHDAKFVGQAPQHAKPGTTKLQLLVNEDGQVVRALVAVSQGDSRVDEWIARGVESWHFKPRVLDGKPVCAWGNYSVTFELVDRTLDDAAQTQPPSRPQ